eukprot:TRINITY_DN107620_c0_g1_i1.p1 TRINITY_DN107620_c0_g1~~TRINITY_DN107620_c0_g1_i1.p1  ORF type:complete len:107 (-),score=18.42 TRINITY_DN107620_c0_g1_i1:11-286(-)
MHHLYRVVRPSDGGTPVCTPASPTSGITASPSYQLEGNNHQRMTEMETKIDAMFENQDELKETVVGLQQQIQQLTMVVTEALNQLALQSAA